jgi:hypothetical protein
MNKKLFYLCYVADKNDKMLVLDYKHFKQFATKENYQEITCHITNNINNILSRHQQFSVFVNMKGLTISEIEKHQHFIQAISVYLKDRYPNMLEKCYIMNAPFVFSQIFNIVSMFIDKTTQSKIEVIAKKDIK